MSSLKLIKQVKSFGGYVKQYAHESKVNNCTMQFCIYLPPTASETTKVPCLYYLAGLTCNEELVMIKSHIQRLASEKGMAIIAPDTSPRGVQIEGQDNSWDFGTGAGFYLNATEPQWSEHYNMYSYVTEELPSIINKAFPVIEGCQSIMGHSMGGHGALTLALKKPGMYKSVSAFAPICHPMECPWGVKAFTGYLGSNQESWKNYDASIIMKEKGPFKDLNILIDQGSDDSFLHDKQLLPEAFEAACREVGQSLKLRFQEGYDHSYYFISSFIDDHMNHHADALFNKAA